MLDIRFIRENPEIIRNALRKRHSNFDFDRFLKADEEYRAVLRETEELRASQNRAGEEVSRSGAGEKEAKIAALKELKANLNRKEEALAKAERDFRKLMLLLPNIPDPSVPEGEGEENNVEIRRWGNTDKFSFPAKDHLALMRDLDLADLERGAKVSGFRGYFLKNDGAMLSLALWKYALDYMVSQGFTPFIAPALVREDVLIATGKLPQFRDDLYATDDGLFLSPTAEVPMMGYYSDEILEEGDLPKKYAAFSPAYRREAGSYGKDTKGLFRLHEFMKVEQVVLCRAEHQESVKWHEELTRYSEEILQNLDIPYRVVINSTGDLPFAFVKMYDIESWLPSEKRYRETHSSSIAHDFQARRLNIRYRTPEGKISFVHSLNNTAIATPRILQALLENHQEADGSVAIPDVLQKYFERGKISPR
ncbi:MAG: serine--tRNA ligase [bacterium]|nr:serine--tRNA ligase [bacterium]